MYVSLNCMNAPECPSIVHNSILCYVLVVMGILAYVEMGVCMSALA